MFSEVNFFMWAIVLLLSQSPACSNCRIASDLLEPRIERDEC